MRLLHSRREVAAVFDEPNLVSCAGLEPVMRLAEDCDLAGLVADRVDLGISTGCEPGAKVAAVVAGMLAGADSIDDLDVLRHGGMRQIFGRVYAPSTLGSFLRSFTWGHSRQLESAGRALLVRLAGRAPLLDGADQVAFVDVDSLLRRVYGHAKQAATFGHAKVGGYNVFLRGLSPLIAVVSTPDSPPVIAATRLRGGNAGSARGAASLVTEAIGTARHAGATGAILVRADSAFYTGAVVTACRGARVNVSITVTSSPKTRAAFASVPEHEWIPIRYPRAVWDDEGGCWISDAQVAEIDYTAFEGTRHQVTARLVVRRVEQLDPKAAEGQDGLFTIWRYHAFFTDTTLDTVAADATHRPHAVVEQTFADLIDGPLAHMPSGVFGANAAWLTLAAMAHNLTRAAATLAGPSHTNARAATIRRHLINVPARVAHRARRLILHLPERWPWRQAWQRLFTAGRAPPPRLA